MADLTSITLPDNTTYNFKDGRISLPLPIADGGTGAATASDAIYNLGAMPAVLEEFEGVGRITYEYGDEGTGHLQFFFHQYTSNNSLGHEFYSLPENTNDDVPEDQYYNIITTKDGSSYFVDLTSSQTIGGTKTFTNNIQISKESPGMQFQNPTGTQIGNWYLGNGVAGIDDIYHATYFNFVERSFNSTTGAILTHSERYQLPSVTADKTQSDQYYIWTSKPGGTTTRPLYVSGSDTVIAIKNENGGFIGEIYWSGSKTNNVTHGRWYLGHYSYNSSTGARLNTYEGYYLPSITADLATSATYEIWTSKENTATNSGSETVIKLKNGIQIIVGKTTKKVTSMTQVGSSGIYCCAITMSWTTTPWYDTNYEISGSTRYSTGHIMPFGMIPSTTTSSTGYLYDSVNRSNVTYNVWYHAVGRWK